MDEAPSILQVINPDVRRLEGIRAATDPLGRPVPACPGAHTPGLTLVSRRAGTIGFL
jgi:hypothetical protein